MIRLAAALTLIATQVGAQGVPCGAKDEAIKHLYTERGETLQSGGLVTIPNGNSMMLIFANEETGTWTLTTLGADGVMCFAVRGENYIADFPRKPNL